ncbi:portal protein [Amaricoccus solimangrovi]|uniref:Portal protein n=1 Tax=Amaricoccus solimangrovi TaxID=2589815 RepID=A0A501X0D3_9RHOB|nr:portal protein [Amaricoccus solimangrovi]TPE53071.1 hypothetical protein FJM51_03335 [Amaricoccus solimangrovi]
MREPSMEQGYERPDHKDALSMRGKPLPDEKRDEAELLQLIRERSVEAQGLWDVNFDLAEDDVDFVEGLNQWPDGAPENNVRLTLSTMHTLVEQVVGENRQSRPAIAVKPTDLAGSGAKLKATTDSGREVEMSQAEAYEGIVRAIEANSGAEAHYDRAFNHAVDGGFGWLRVYTRYANGKDFDQELVIASVRNRWSVLTGPFEELDGSDMPYALVAEDMPRREFERRYPDAAPGDLFAGLPEDQRLFWAKDGRVRVAEYMERVAVEQELLLLTDGRLFYRDELKDLLAPDGALIGAPPTQEGPVRVDRARKIVTWKVLWRKVTGHTILEGGVKGLELPFCSIPIVPVLGRARDRRNGETIYSSLIRFAKDPQRMKNYWHSKATERMGRASNAPWVGPAEAFEGYEHEWQEANSGQRAFLRYNGAQIPTRDHGPAIPTAEIQMAAIMTDNVKSATGIYDSSIGAASNETSGRAINSRKVQSSTTNFTYPDNLGRAIRRVGLLLVDAIPRIYDTERVLRLLGEDGKGVWLAVNQQIAGPDGLPAVSQALGKGEFDVSVKAGPNFATQREAAADGMMQISQTAPDLLPVIGDKMVENMDWPQASQIAARMRRMMDPKLLSPEERAEIEQEAKAGQQPGPDGQPQPSPEQQQAAMAEQAMQMRARVEQAKAEAEMEKAEADKLEARAKAAEAMAKLAALGFAPGAPAPMPPAPIEQPPEMGAPQPPRPPAGPMMAPPAQ